MSTAQDQFFAELARKMRLFVSLARDPQHPMHNEFKWNERTGQLILDDEESCDKAITAALQEPDVD